MVDFEPDGNAAFSFAEAPFPIIPLGPPRPKGNAPTEIEKKFGKLEMFMLSGVSGWTIIELF